MEWLAGIFQQVSALWDASLTKLSGQVPITCPDTLRWGKPADKDVRLRTVISLAARSLAAVPVRQPNSTARLATTYLHEEGQQP